MIVLVANLKGGITRTTVSVMLARAYGQAGEKVILADTTVGGDSVRYVENMKKKHGLDIPFDVCELPSDPIGHNQNLSGGRTKLRARIQSLRESMGSEGVVVVDTSSHDEDTLRSLDRIATNVVVPYDCSGAALGPTLRTIDVLTAPTTVLVHRRFSTIDARDMERLNQVVEKADHVSRAVWVYDEKYTKCDIPDSTFEFDQLVSDLSQ